MTWSSSSDPAPRAPTRACCHTATAAVPQRRTPRGGRSPRSGCAIVLASSSVLDVDRPHLLGVQLEGCATWRVARELDGPGDAAGDLLAVRERDLQVGAGAQLLRLDLRDPLQRYLLAGVEGDG